jgi:hypothetical protein
MGDFRVGNTSPIPPYGQEPSNTDSRKKDRRPKDPTSEQADEDVVVISGQTGDAEAVVDYYAPSLPDEEPE